MTSVDRDRAVQAGSGLPIEPPEAARGPSRRSRMTSALDQYAGVLVVLVLAVVLLTVTQEQFLTVDNMVNILETNAVLLVVAVGLTFVLLVGGIDLSIGGTMALSAVVLWELTARQGLSVPLAVVLVISMAFVLGFCVNGLLIGKVGLSFLVVTIGTASLYRGIAQVRTGGQSQSLFEQTALIDFGSADRLGLPVTVWLALSVLVLGMLVLRHTGYGRMVYVTGGNPEAARLSGINTALVRVSVFGIAAGLAGLAAVMDASRLTAASPSAATGIELTAGAAVLLGGTSFMGGRGTLLGTLLGVLFLGVLQNGLTLSGTSPFWSGIVSGAVLIAAIFVDRIRNGAATP